MGFWKKLFGGGEGEAPASPRDHFAAEVEACLRQLPQVSTVKARDDFALDVTITGGGVHTVFMENTFHETRDMSPDERMVRISRLVSGIGQEEELDWESAKERLVPLVRACTVFAGVVPDADKQPLSRVVLPFLVETVVIDSEANMRYVTPSTVEEWGVDPETVFRHAQENAERFFDVDDAEIYEQKDDSTIWHVTRDDSYESSRLLLPGWLASFRGKVNGNPVAIVPERAKLFVAGDGDVLCLERLLDMAEREYAASRRSISPAMYTVDDTGAVIPLALPDKHPLRNPVALGHARLALAEYDIQQKVLQKDREEDVFVASYVAVQREDGTITSYSTWTDGVPTWLPKTDDVALVGGNPEDPTVLRVPWEAMEGMLRELPDVYPPRFETGDWPDAADLEKLRAVAL